jgi:2-phospho-L-lactate/phosphoenolpyruvate guanylyltransferase
MQVLAVPVKALDRGKERLSGILSPSERSRLVLAMFRGVLDATLAQRGWSVQVVSSSEEVLREAERLGAEPVRDRGASLRAAIRQVASALPSDATLGVLLADLPRITAPALAGSLADADGAPVAAVPAHSDGGTNLLVRRPASVIPDRFGRSSFERHRAEAYRAGVTLRELRRWELAFDLDTPQDLARWLETDGEGPAFEVAAALGLRERLGSAARR